MSLRVGSELKVKYHKCVSHQRRFCMRVQLCSVCRYVLGLVRKAVGGGFNCGPACYRGSGKGCGVTAQPSLPAADKAARHRHQLILLLLNYLEEMGCWRGL